MEFADVEISPSKMSKEEAISVDEEDEQQLESTGNGVSKEHQGKTFFVDADEKRF